MIRGGMPLALRRHVVVTWDPPCLCRAVQSHRHATQRALCLPMDINQRIAQFENIVQADPENSMAHYSLGGAYAQAERWGDTAASYLNCVARNQAMSKAYQLAGEALIKAGDKDKAAAVLVEGYKTASGRGDRMPMKAMGELLTKLGVA